MKTGFAKIFLLFIIVILVAVGSYYMYLFYKHDSRQNFLQIEKCEKQGHTWNYDHNYCS